LSVVLISLTTSLDGLQPCIGFSLQLLFLNIDIITGKPLIRIRD